MEDAENKSAGTERTRVKQVLPHEGKFVAGIEEVSGAWPQKDMNRKPALKDGFADKTMARGETTFTQGGTEFDAVGSSVARCETSLDGLDAEFKDNLAHSVFNLRGATVVSRMGRGQSRNPVPITLPRRCISH